MDISGTCTKMRFYSKDAAEQRLAELALEPTWRGRKKPVRAYPCPDCSNQVRVWHLTTRASSRSRHVMELAEKRPQ